MSDDEHRQHCADGHHEPVTTKDWRGKFVATRITLQVEMAEAGDEHGMSNTVFLICKYCRCIYA